MIKTFHGKKKENMMTLRLGRAKTGKLEKQASSVLMKRERDEDGVNSLLEKARELLFNSQSMKILAGVLTAYNYHDLLNSVSRDILCSWSDELLFGLVFFVVVGSN